jgi:hypothetical protein
MCTPDAQNDHCCDARLYDLCRLTCSAQAQHRNTPRPSIFLLMDIRVFGLLMVTAYPLFWCGERWQGARA